MTEPARITVAEAVRCWCADPLPSAPATGHADHTRAYHALRAFIAARCAKHRVSDPGTVEDIVHEVVERLSRLPAPPDHPAAYLRSTVRNAVIDRFRKKDAPPFEADPPEVVDHAPTHDATLAAEQEATLIAGRLQAWLEASLTDTEGRCRGMRQRMQASLHILDTAEAVSPAPAATESQTRTARRHRQMLEDHLYEDLRRAYAVSTHAAARVHSCPTRVDAAKKRPSELLAWLTLEPPGSDARAFISLWLCFLAFRNRFRLRAGRGESP